MTKGRVLVTDATSFIGSHVVRLLLEHGYRVRGCVRNHLHNNQNKKHQKHHNTDENVVTQTKYDSVYDDLNPSLERQNHLELIEVPSTLDDADDNNTTATEAWQRIMRGCDYVILSTPTSSSTGLDEPTKVRRSGGAALDGVLHVLRAAQAENVKKVVLTSSSLAVYDSLKADDARAVKAGTTTNETSAGNVVVHDERGWTQIGGNHKRSPYVESKVRIEQAAWDFYTAQPEQTRTSLTTILPTTATAGPILFSNPHQHHHNNSSPTYSGGVMQHIIETILNHHQSSVPNLGLALCDVRDVALAHMRALDGGERSSDAQRILIYSRSLWLVEVAEILRREFTPHGYVIQTRRAPRLFAKLSLGFNKYYRHVAQSSALDKQPMFDNSRMRQVLGIDPPTSAERSIIDMAHSLIQRGDIHMTARYAEWLQNHPENRFFAQTYIAQRIAEENADAGDSEKKRRRSRRRKHRKSIKTNKRKQVYAVNDATDNVEMANRHQQTSAQIYTNPAHAENRRNVDEIVEERETVVTTRIPDENNNDIAASSSRHHHARSTSPRVMRREAASSSPAVRDAIIIEPGQQNTTTTVVDERRVESPRTRGAGGGGRYIKTVDEQTVVQTTRTTPATARAVKLIVDDIPVEVTM